MLSPTYCCPEPEPDPEPDPELVLEFDGSIMNCFLMNLYRPKPNSPTATPYVKGVALKYTNISPNSIIIR